MGNYPRDLVGYGQAVPNATWPGDARVAVQFVLNYEEGGENSILHGDPASEIFLSDPKISEDGKAKVQGERQLKIEGKKQRQEGKPEDIKRHSPNMWAKSL